MRVTWCSLPSPGAALVVRPLSRGQVCSGTHLPKPQLADPEGHLQALQGARSSGGRARKGQAHSISKCGLLFQETKSTRNPEQCPASALTGTPQLHPHTRPTHSHCEATSQPEACAHGDSPPEWEAAREEAQAGLSSGLGTGILGSLSPCRFQVGTTLASETPHP